MVRSTLMILVALALVACGDDDGTAVVDSGVAVDSGTGGMDSGPRPDAGPGDECAADDDPTSTVGCNGFVSGDAPANQPGGTCTPGGESNPAGSCTTPQTLCDAAEGAATGECLALCPPADTYVSTGGCPSGFRCFTLEFEEPVGICFRDCDATHPCGTGQECDSEGSCVPEQVDGGTPPADAGTDSDAGMPDAGTSAG